LTKRQKENELKLSEYIRKKEEESKVKTKK